MGKRERTKRSIIEAAAAVCLDKGLSEASMEVVAAAAGCHRRTLYRYFPQREDLLYEVVIYLLERLNRFQLSSFSGLSGTGIEKFTSFFAALTRYMEEHRSAVRFMGEFDFYFNESRRYVPPADIQQSFIKAAHVTEDILRQIMKTGLEDGSITLPAGQDVFIPTITTVLWGTAQRIALRGHKIQDEFGVSGMDMVRCQLDIYVNTIAGE